MKNSTTAFILTIMCMTGDYFSNGSHMFIASAIFAATYLILQELEDK